MHHAVGLFLLAPLFAVQSVKGEELKQQFETLDQKADHAGVVALWRAHPAETLGVIDSYLEGSLARVERAPDTDPGELKKMRDRALRGARAADEAFGTAIFSDYASSFAGWDGEQQKRFREGQAAYGKARQAARASDFETALREGERCVELARPLGDWWGTAMGLSIAGQAQVRLGRAEKALEALSQSRLLNAELHLDSAEYADGLSIARLCVELGRRERGRVAIEHALALADRLRDADGPLALLELRVQLESAPGGDAETASAAKAELERRKSAKSNK
jgi:hypothetical protein